MKLFSRIFPIFVIYLFLLSSVSEALAQTEDDLDCYFSADTTQILPESMPVLQDTSLRIAILFVQFADWETNINARGSVGWKNSTDPDSFQFDKFRYHHFWEMYFTRNTYIDTLNVTPPITHHPDYSSHGTTVYGSFRDYWHEVSHGELDTKPANTKYSGMAAMTMAAEPPTDCMFTRLKRKQTVTSL